MHDPQPICLPQFTPPGQVARWIWRCHIDASRPNRSVWKYLERAVSRYDAAIFSMPAFARPLACPMFLIPPSIDPLSDKNCAIPESERLETLARLGIDAERPLLVQVSRFDRFKDPLGVIAAYRLLKPYYPKMQLALAGGPADDDPEGAQVLGEVRDLAGDDADLKVLMLPPDAHRTINALQRSATVVLQKSLKEGFGLTVTEALWKGKPVIGGACGGITLQVHDYQTGFLVYSPAGAAYRVHYLLRYADKRQRMGQTGPRLRACPFLADPQPPRLSDDAPLPGPSRIDDTGGLGKRGAGSTQSLILHPSPFIPYRPCPLPPVCLTIVTSFPRELKSTRSMKACISKIPRPVTFSRFAGSVGSGTAAGSKPGP